MLNQNGFSLIEVLVSLLLITTTSLLLLRQQWQLNQLFNSTLISLSTLVQLENDKEQA